MQLYFTIVLFASVTQQECLSLKKKKKKKKVIILCYEEGQQFIQ